MKANRIILAAVSLFILCGMLAGCGILDQTPRLDGSYEIEAVGTKTVYTFDDKSDLVTIKYFIAGMEVYSQAGKYSINDEETEITLSIPKDNSTEAENDVPEALLSGIFTFERGEGYIVIGNMKYVKSGASDKGM